MLSDLELVKAFFTEDLITMILFTQPIPVVETGPRSELTKQWMASCACMLNPEDYAWISGEINEMWYRERPDFRHISYPNEFVSLAHNGRCLVINKLIFS